MAARGRAVIGARGDFNGMVRRMTLWAMVQGASGPVNVAIEHNGKGQRAKRRLALRRGQVPQGGEGLARQVLLDPGPFGAKQMLIALEDHVRQPRSSRAKGLPPQMADTGHGIAHAAIGQCGRGNGLDRGRRETFPGGGHWGGEKRTSDGPFPPPHTPPPTAHHSSLATCIRPEKRPSPRRRRKLLLLPRKMRGPSLTPTLERIVLSASSSIRIINSSRFSL